jgi:hypothetical protein
MLLAGTVRTASGQSTHARKFVIAEMERAALPTLSA